MKLLTAIVAVTLIATPAFSADMAVKAPPPAPVYSWTGFYVGGNAGYAWQDPPVTFTPNDTVSYGVTCSLAGFTGGGCPPATAFNTGGALAGVQAGYNLQVNPTILIGVEADFDWSQIRGTGYSNFGLDFSPATFHASENVTYFGTVRGRLGYLPLDRVLLFVTGGLAYGHVEENVGLDGGSGGVGYGGYGYNCSGGPNCFIGSSSHNGLGWTAGAGFEYALWRNLKFKAEYLFVNLGGGQAVNVAARSAMSFPNASSFTAAYGAVTFQVLRAGLNIGF